MEGSHPELVPFHKQKKGVRRLAKPAGTLDQRIEHRLQICRGARDDSEDFTGRGLLLQRLSDLPVRLGQLPILLLQLGEQAHVLESDDGLMRERA